MGIWSAIFKARNNKGVHRQVKAAGVLRDEEGWYYEESQNFSRSQSTVRIDQQRPGDWEILESSCGIVGLNQAVRQKEVGRFFAGSYRWLRLERELNGCGLDVEMRYADVAGSTYNPEHPEFAVVARKR